MVRHKAPGSTSKKGGVEESTRVSKDKPVAFQALQGSEYKYSTAHQIRVVTGNLLKIDFVFCGWTAICSPYLSVWPGH